MTISGRPNHRYMVLFGAEIEALSTFIKSINTEAAAAVVDVLLRLCVYIFVCLCVLGAVRQAPAAWHDRGGGDL